MSIKIEKVEIFGWEAAVRGARNPKNSWMESDSRFYDYGSSDGINDFNHYHTLQKEQVKIPVTDVEWVDGIRDLIGPNDYRLLMNQSKGGSEESKWRRMIHVQLDITAPLYWWKEFDTYKCSPAYRTASRTIAPTASQNSCISTGTGIFPPRGSSRSKKSRGSIRNRA